ncbi:hypothetical protein [Streptomyces sp. NPDC007355]
MRHLSQQLTDLPQAQPRAPGRPLIMYYGGDLVEAAFATVLAAS